jgi:thiol-activated cytolysin
MEIQITDLSPNARWEGAQLIDAHNGRDAVQLPWMGSDGDSRGFARLDAIALEDGNTVKALRTHPKWVENGTIKGWHPPVQLPANAVFEADIGFVYGARGTDGVTFQVWEHHTQGGRPVWNQIISVRKGYTGSLQRVRADLSHLAGQQVGIELRVDAGPSAGQDWAAWTNMRIFSANNSSNSSNSNSSLSVQVSRSGQGSESPVGASTEEAKGEYVCRVQKKQVTEVFSTNLLLDPTTDVIWPGSIVDGSSIASGQYRPITDKRAPLTFSISLENIAGSALKTVQTPTLSSVRDAANELRRQNMQGATLANIVYEKEEIRSEEQLKLALGAHYNDGMQKISGSFDFSSSSVANKILVKYIQKYYTIDIDPPARPQDFFASPRTITADDMYVASVTYGRMLLFTFESTEDITKLKAAVDYAYGQTAGGNFSGEYKNILNRTKTNVLVIGGSAEDGVKVITNGVDGINQYITNGANYSPNSPGAPLSYKLRYVSDNAIGNVIMSTTFYERNCQKTTGTFKAKIVKLKCMAVDDPGSNEEFYGKITVIAYEGEGREIGRQVVWNVAEKNHVSLRKNAEHLINAEARFTFKNFHLVKDTAFIKVEANLREDDDFGGDDNFGTQSKKVYLSEAADDPNKGAGDDPGSDRKLFFQHGGSRAEIWFDVTPV